jgi:predicted DNA-binding transcriptional regulator YafY
MLETSARLFRLLSLLQMHRDWSGPDLAERLGVTTRTIRNDVDRLRNLGYPIHATPGVAGGYRLGAGAELPPLLLDDDEAVAVAVGLRTAAAGSVAGIEETSLRALAKLEQVLPSRLAQRVNALQTSTVPMPGSGPTVRADILAAIAGACRDHEQLRFDYRTHAGEASVRAVEPYRLVSWGRRWYLVAWDTDRGAWRTYRADRIEPRLPTGPRFRPREPPADDIAAYVAKGVGSVPWRVQARVTVHESAEALSARMPPSLSVEPVDEETCVVNVGSDTPFHLAAWLGWLGTDFEVTEPPELVDELRRLASRYRHATDRDQ